jgi:hypothetical protein
MGSILGMLNLKKKLDPNLVTKIGIICSTVKFAEQNSRFLPFLGGICMEGTLRMSNFKILSIFLASGLFYGKIC